VAVAIDSTLYQTHVFAGSHGDMNVRSPQRRNVGNSATTWGDRPVLLLLGIRFSIDGVNYDTIKVTFFNLLSTWTLTVLIAFVYLPSIGWDGRWKTKFFI
jgi:hypothetical protein